MEWLLQPVLLVLSAINAMKGQYPVIGKLLNALRLEHIVAEGLRL